MKKTPLSTTTLTFLAGVAGAGPLPSDAEQLNRHRREDNTTSQHSVALRARIRHWFRRNQ